MSKLTAIECPKCGAHVEKLPVENDDIDVKNSTQLTCPNCGNKGAICSDAVRPDRELIGIMRTMIEKGAELPWDLGNYVSAIEYFDFAENRELAEVAVNELPYMLDRIDELTEEVALLKAMKEKALNENLIRAMLVPDKSKKFSSKDLRVTVSGNAVPEKLKNIPFVPHPLPGEVLEEKALHIDLEDALVDEPEKPLLVGPSVDRGNLRFIEELARRTEDLPIVAIRTPDEKGDNPRYLEKPIELVVPKEEASKAVLDEAMKKVLRDTYGDRPPTPDEIAEAVEEFRRNHPEMEFPGNVTPLLTREALEEKALSISRKEEDVPPNERARVEAFNETIGDAPSGIEKPLSVLIADDAVNEAMGKKPDTDAPLSDALSDEERKGKVSVSYTREREDTKRITLPTRGEGESPDSTPSGNDEDDT